MRCVRCGSAATTSATHCGLCRRPYDAAPSWGLREHDAPDLLDTPTFVTSESQRYQTYINDEGKLASRDLGREPPLTKAQAEKLLQLLYDTSPTIT